MYHARHRKPLHRGKGRAAVVAVSLAASTMTAPLTATAPAQATIVSPVGLSNFLVTDGRTLYADDVKSVIDYSTSHGYHVIPAAVQVYSVPTVDGFVRYITDRPQTFRMTSNPGLLEHTPDGDTPVDPRLVLSRLVGSNASRLGDGILPQIYLADVLPEIDTLQQLVSDVIRDATNLQGAIDVLNEVLDVFRNLYIRGVDPWPEGVDVNAAIGVVVGVVGILTNLLSRPPTPEDIQRAIQPYLDLMPTVDVGTLLTAAQQYVSTEVNALLRQIGFGDIYDAYQSLYTVTPMANAALLVNKQTTTTAPSTALDAATWNYAPSINRTGSAYTKPEGEDPPPAKWVHNDDNCYGSNSDAWRRTVCWRIDNQEYDRSDSYAYWQFHMEASGEPQNDHWMKRLWVEGSDMQSNNRSYQFWDGRLPEPNATQGGTSSTCTTNTKSFAFGSGDPLLDAYTDQFQYTTCEKWVPKSYDNQGHWSTTWQYNSHAPKVYDMRHTAFTMAVRTYADGTLPGWLLYDGTEVSNAWKD